MIALSYTVHVQDHSTGRSPSLPAASAEEAIETAAREVRAGRCLMGLRAYLTHPGLEPSLFLQIEREPEGNPAREWALRPAGSGLAVRFVEFAVAVRHADRLARAVAAGTALRAVAR